MRKLIVLFIAGSIGLKVMAQADGFGIGIILGEPTGLSGKLWLTQKTAVDGALAWSLWDGGAVHIHADFLVHNFNLINVSQGQLPLYIGIGPRIKLANDPMLGVRVPFGLAYLFGSAPLDVFLELVPILELIPASDFHFNSAIGIRYFF